MESLGEELKAIADKVLNDRERSQELMESELRGLFFDFLNDWMRKEGIQQMRDEAKKGERKIDFCFMCISEIEEIMPKCVAVFERYEANVETEWTNNLQKDAWKRWADNNNLQIYFPVDDNNNDTIIISW